MRLNGMCQLTLVGCSSARTRELMPFSWYEPMWMENLGFAEVGEGWKLTESGATGPDGKLPVNMSGGVLS